MNDLTAMVAPNLALSQRAVAAEPPRVLLIGPRPPPPTGQSVALEVLVSAFERQGAAEVVDLAERFGRRDKAFSVRRALLMLRGAVGVLRRTSRVEAVYMQVAQSRWGLLRDCLFFAVARLAGRPIVAHLHGGGYGEFYASEPRPIQWLIRRSLRSTSRMIVLSDALRENFAFMGGEYGSRIRVVPNPSPVEPGGPRAAPEGEVRLLYLSNLLVEKGYLDCVDAMVHIRRSLPGRRVKLILAGAPLLGGDEYLDIADLERTLRKHIRYLGVEDAVEIAGLVMGKKKLELLASAHIALLPTYYRNEGQPIALIEAMASGLPFVATAWRGIADLAGRDVGILVPPRSPLAIADAVTELASNRELYARMSRNAVAYSGQFARELHIERMMSVFREVCASRRKRGAGGA